MNARLKSDVADAAAAILAFIFLLCIVLLFGVFLVGPAVIWALNTLFKLGIEQSFWNWLAVWVLWAAIRPPFNTTEIKAKLKG
jgi:uncharacterized Tic20 family protein